MVVVSVSVCLCIYSMSERHFLCNIADHSWSCINKQAKCWQPGDVRFVWQRGKTPCSLLSLVYVTRERLKDLFGVLNHFSWEARILDERVCLRRRWPEATVIGTDKLSSRRCDPTRAMRRYREKSTARTPGYIGIVKATARRSNSYWIAGVVQAWQIIHPNPTLPLPTAVIDSWQTTADRAGSPHALRTRHGATQHPNSPPHDPEPQVQHVETPRVMWQGAVLNASDQVRLGPGPRV